MNQDANKSNLKIFFIKLTSIALATVVVVSLIYNLIFAEKFEILNKFLSLSNKENIELIKNKARVEIEKGINRETNEVVVEVDSKYFRPTEVELLIGDPAKANTELGWKHKYDLAALVKDMMQSDLKLFQKDKYLKEGGYQTMSYFE